MFYSRKDTIINIVLIVVSVLVVVSCLLLYFNREVITEEVVLVKDMSDSVGRIKSDKNEDMRTNKVVLDSDLEITEDGTIILRPDEPTDMKNPDDVFLPEKPNIVPRDENTKMVKSPKIEEKKGEVLPLHELDTVIETIRVESTTVKDATVHSEKEDNIEKLLRQARIDRNKGRNNVSLKLNFIRNGLENISFETANTNGAIVIPFLLTNENSLKTVKEVSNYYDEYKNSVRFMFLNVSFDGLEPESKILQKFKELDIREDLPLFFDTGGNFMASVDGITSANYYIFNSDGYIVKYAKLGESKSEIDKVLSDLSVEQKFIKEENQKILENETYVPLEERKEKEE